MRRLTLSHLGRRILDTADRPEPVDDRTPAQRRADARPGCCSRNAAAVAFPLPPARFSLVHEIPG